MVLKILVALICFFTPVLLAAQDFNYVHYDTKDGLAGSTVYSICQDKDGFIWFGTENGLSRYDGTHFKNFTVKDGLPDNEVLKVFADSRGRVWTASFSKEICYCYKGKIYNKENDSLVRKMQLGESVYLMSEDDNHLLGICTNSSVSIITAENQVLNYKLADIYTKKYEYGYGLALYNGKLVVTNNKYEAFGFNYTNLKWEKIFIPWVVSRLEIKVKPDSFITNIKNNNPDSKNQYIPIAFPGKYISSVNEHDTSYIINYVNTTDGAWHIDQVAKKQFTHFLPGKKISWVLEDKEKNIWFSTLGSGLYKLPSKTVKTFTFYSDKKNTGSEVFSIVEFNQGVLTGMEANKAMLVNKDFSIKEMSYKNYEIHSGVAVATNRLYSMVNISSSTTVLGFDKFLVKLEHGKSMLNYIFPIKSVAKIDNDFILVGTSAYAFKMRLKDMQITDTVWHERCTKVFYQNHTYYIGTLNGLHEVRQDKNAAYLGNLHHALTRRIMDIKTAADGTLWIATSDNGIVAFKDGKIIKVITDSSGLSSNICKTLFIEGNNLWIGTDKGINKINTNDTQYHITRYSTSDGLPSNTINALYVKDSIVWIGSPAGLTYFNENNISSSSICNLNMLSIQVSGKEVKPDSVFHLSYKDNNIHFDYAGISFRSGGEISYFYKLSGLDKELKTTTENNLDYKSLPAANYTLELYAINKYGIKSNTITITFSIAAPFWKTIWFYLLLSALIIAGIILVFNRRNKNTRQRLEEKNNFQKQFAALEQQALQSQMNPHFIFNCLNSIQQYILTNEKEKANQYLTGFATLIRQTLDISAQKTITVAEEASYLKKYLDMERMRFGDSFTFNIHVDETAHTDHIQIPALLLQPYVENSLRHGIRYKTEGAGKIDISFTQKEGNLSCMIKDNGIGRDKAAEFKSKQHIEYQSKGMSLTGKRIELLNTISENKIAVTVTDLKNNDNSAAGTLVEINIPI